MIHFQKRTLRLLSSARGAGLESAGPLREDAELGSGELDVESRHEHDGRPLGDYGFMRRSGSSPHVLCGPTVSRVDSASGICLPIRV